MLNTITAILLDFAHYMYSLSSSRTWSYIVLKIINCQLFAKGRGDNSVILLVKIQENSRKIIQRKTPGWREIHVRIRPTVCEQTKYLKIYKCFNFDL